MRPKTAPWGALSESICVEPFATASTTPGEPPKLAVSVDG